MNKIAVNESKVKEAAGFIWSIADLLRGHFKQHEYGSVILPFITLRRLDMILEPTKDKVLAEYRKNKSKKPQALELLLNNITKLQFHNRSQFTFDSLVQDHANVEENILDYIRGFSEQVQDIFENFKFGEVVRLLNRYDLLFLVVKHFANSRKVLSDVSTIEMGYVYEELIRKFAEASNETAGEHFTPREVIRLMVNLLFDNDVKALTKGGVIRTLYDPACGTGGMLAETEQYFREINHGAKIRLYGQEVNPESYAICKSDMMIKGLDGDAKRIALGNSFTEDQHAAEKFHYMLCNPPFGVDWKKIEKKIKDEAEKQGHAGRFGAGLPPINDGSLLFLQHMISKMHQGEEGSRIAIVFNGSPLFSGGAGSGPSCIRQWIIERDMLDAIIAMPDQLFYNTGISTYVWIVTNRKTKKRRGKVQLINATGSEFGEKDNPFYAKMTRSLGDKRKLIPPSGIKRICEIYSDFEENEHCKIFDNEDFGYRRITIEQPKRDGKGKVILDKKGNPSPDSSLRDFENVPLKEDIHEYFDREVAPHVPDAWIDESKTKIGYEINFTKYFYRYKPLRSLEEIRRDILALEKETDGMIRRVLS